MPDDIQTTDSVAALLEGYSLEVTARDHAAAEVCRNHLKPGVEVYIAFVPGDTHHKVVEQSARLHAAGFVPVPHITARSIASFTQADGFLARLAGEAGVTRALVIGGDADQPAGPYPSSLELLRTGLFQEHGLRHIGLACYPEPHRKIGPEALDRALAAKLDLLRKAGPEAWLVSQFCFEAPLIIRLAEKLLAQGITTPLRVGLPGPADRRTLWKYALHCGIGNSIRALGTRVDAVANLLSRRAPDGIVAAIAHARRGNPALGIEGVHIFTFGGVASAACWANSILGAAEAQRD